MALDLNPSTQAALDAWLISISNWREIDPMIEERFFEFVNQYQREHGFSIDKQELVEQLNRAALARDQSKIGLEPIEVFFGYYVDVAITILDFLRVTGR